MYVGWYWLNWLLVWVVVNLVCEQWRTSATLAQESYSRLGESCRISYQVLTRACCPGDQYQDWATRSLAQARMARLSESLGNLNHFLSTTSHPGERYWGSKRQDARLGKNGSPKRGRDEKWWLFDWILVQARCVC